MAWVAAIRVDCDGPAAPGDGIGAVVRFLGHFRVFVHDDDQGRLFGCGFPDALAFAGHLCGPLIDAFAATGLIPRWVQSHRIGPSDSP